MHEAMFSLDRFVVEDVLVNTIYAENLRVLAELIRREETTRMRPIWTGARKRPGRAGRKCYDASAGLFFDLAGTREQPLRVNTISSLVAILLPDLPSDRPCARGPPFRSAGVRGGISSAQRGHE